MSNKLSMQFLHFVAGFGIGVMLYQLIYLDNTSQRDHNSLNFKFKEYFYSGSEINCQNYVIGDRYYAPSFLNKALSDNRTQSRSLKLTNKSINLVSSRNVSRIMCIINFPVSQKRLRYAVAINKTWGSYCDKLIFIVPAKHKKRMRWRINMKLQSLNIIFLKTKDNNGGMSERLLWESIYKSYLLHFDWFFKSDINSYNAIQNLRHHLQSYSSELSFFLGNSINTNDGICGEPKPGFILSREGVSELVKNCPLPKSPSLFENFIGRGISNDDHLFSCISKVELNLIRPLDQVNRPLFVSRSLEEVITHKDSSKGSKIKGFECCSDNLISFRITKLKSIYSSHYYIHQLRPYGIGSKII